jgi:hypothetical protein
MPHATVTPSAVHQLQSRLPDLWDRSVDIFERELQSFHRTCVRAHCRRLWEMLDADERASIHKEIAHQMQSESGSSSDLFVDAQCINVIEEYLRALGKLAPTYPRTKTTRRTKR